MESTEHNLRDYIDPDGNAEIDTEAKALEYMDFLQTKVDQLLVENEAMMKKAVAERDAQMDTMPRSVRRMFQKEKFSDRFKKNINTK